MTDEMVKIYCKLIKNIGAQIYTVGGNDRKVLTSSFIDRSCYFIDMSVNLISFPGITLFRC